MLRNKDGVMTPKDRDEVKRRDLRVCSVRGGWEKYQVSSLTVVNGLHNLGYITTCLLCQFDFKSVFVVVEQLLLRHEHFYGTKRLIFCSLVTSSIHTSSFNCVTKKSCLLPFIIGYQTIGIVILSKDILIERRLGSVEIRKGLR
jgi:hypothetical protein